MESYVFYKLVLESLLKTTNKNVVLKLRYAQNPVF